LSSLSEPVFREIFHRHSEGIEPWVRNILQENRSSPIAWYSLVASCYKIINGVVVVVVEVIVVVLLLVLVVVVIVLVIIVVLIVLSTVLASRYCVYIGMIIKHF